MLKNKTFKGLKLNNAKFFYLIISVIILFPSVSNADDWTYEFEPYVMAPNIEGDASIGRATGAQVDVDTEAILDNLDLGGMLHFEAHNKNSWGFSLDYSFMELSSEMNPVGNAVIKAEARQAILEGLVIKRTVLENGHLDYFFGFRWWDNDIDIDINIAILPGSVSANIEEDWIDPVIGFRWVHNINSNWQYTLKADIGGFGIGSDFTSLASTGVRYSFNENWDLDLQLKGIWVDYENGTRGQPGYFEYDTVTYGPIIGIIYKF